MNKFYKKLLLTLCALTVSTSAFCMYDGDDYYTKTLKPQLNKVYDSCGKDGSGLLNHYLPEITQPKYNRYCNKIRDFLNQTIENHQAHAEKGLPSKYFVLSQVVQEYNLWLATQPQALSVIGKLEGKENQNYDSDSD